VVASFDTLPVRYVSMRRRNVAASIVGVWRKLAAWGVRVTDHDQRWSKGGWRSPAGIGTIAAVAGVLVAVIALFANRPGPSEPGAVGASPSAGSSVFVYGTTMPNHLRYPLIEEYVASATPDRATGRIFDTGLGYPAAKFGGQGTIEGYVLRLRSDRVSEAMRAFTEMEAGLFHPVTITTAGGVSAVAYEYIGSTANMTAVSGQWSGTEA
jgi:gamma-glutamylcyclotransferase (GGCT)/AIG2-like uncharacterized protein YtfP